MFEKQSFNSLSTLSPPCLLAHEIACMLGKFQIGDTHCRVILLNESQTEESIHQALRFFSLKANLKSLTEVIRFKVKDQLCVIVKDEQAATKPLATELPAGALPREPLADAPCAIHPLPTEHLCSEEDDLSTAEDLLISSLLTERELQIAALVALGKVNKQIAIQLHISEWTVATYLRRMFAKLRVDSRAALVYRCAPLIRRFQELSPPATKS